MTMSFELASTLPDIEEARNHLDGSNQEQLGKSKDAEHPESKIEKRAEIGIDHPEDIKKVQVGKVVVLSFRTLQLQRNRRVAR